MNLNKHIKQLEEFQRAFGADCNYEYTDLSLETRNLRINLFDEEAEEFLKAFRLNDEVEVLDSILDCIYIIIGTAVSFGVQDKLKIGTSTYPFESKDSKRLMLGCLMSSGNIAHITETPTADYMLHIEELLSLDLTNINQIARNIYGDSFRKVIEMGLDIVHASNMSKLDDNKKPIINGENGVLDSNKPLGKILKSSNYFEPTEQLKNLLTSIKQ